MDVDSPQDEESRKVSVHPVRKTRSEKGQTWKLPPHRSSTLSWTLLRNLMQLAIVNMSDQFTRITCGGSALSKDAPVVGLLFGHSLKDGLQIVDADDIPTDRSEAAKSQVSLHHAVFPLHDVVGWYRVGNSEEPTGGDLRLTQELKAHYQDGADKPFVFSLLQVKPSKEGKEDPNMKDEGNDDDELPLNLYEVQVNDQSPVLVGVENWSLQTSEAERIAVERVVREQPQQDLQAGAKSGKEETEVEAAASQPSPYNNYMSSVQSSLQAMDDRVKTIIDYLERMGKGEIPPNYSLLRQIQGLTLQLGPLQQASSGPKLQKAPSAKDAELLSHLAAIAKTVQSVHSYTEKFRTLHENRPSGGREGRRGY